MKSNEEIALEVFKYISYAEVVWVKAGEFHINDPRDLSWERFERNSIAEKPKKSK